MNNSIQIGKDTYEFITQTHRDNIMKSLVSKGMTIGKALQWVQNRFIVGDYEQYIGRCE